MPTTEARQEFARYLVEVTPPGGGEIDIRDLATRSRAACVALSAEGIAVRLLRSVFVPEDGSCLLVFEAKDAAAVHSASERAGMPVERPGSGRRLHRGRRRQRPDLRLPGPRHDPRRSRRRRDLREHRPRQPEGGEGSDKIHGNEGPDTLTGDLNTGQKRKDVVLGDGGNDKLFANDGVFDVVRGGPGDNDKAKIDEAVDTVTGVEVFL